MKAVKQIIDYLRGRGLLSREYLLELASGGFLPWGEVYEGEPPDEPGEAEDRATAPPEDDEDYEALVRPRAGAKKGKGGHRKAPVLEPAAICGRLAARFDAWRGPLDGLVRVARRLGECDGWEEAAVVLRNADPEELARAVGDGLEEQAPSLALLWQALSHEDYRTVLNDPEVHGPAATAYRAILAIDDHSSLGRHVWLLREPEVASIFNLKQTQRQLLRACGSVFRDRPELIAAGLRGDFHAPAYWAFVLLYSARRGLPGDRPLPAGHEHRPARGLPGDAALMQAWAQALAMDPAAVTPFLIEYNVLQSQRLQAVSYALRRFHAHLAAPDQELLTLYFGKRLSTHEIATQLGTTPAEVEARLHTLRQALGEALAVSSALQLALHAEAEPVRQALIEDCLGWCFGGGAGSPPALSPDVLKWIQRYFGPAADLLCPRSWD